MQAEQAGQRMGQGRLADAGQIFDQQVTARQQAGERQTYLALLAEDDATGGREDGVESARLGGERR